MIVSECVVKKRTKLKRRFWIRPSLRNRNKYRGSDLIKELILDDADNINLEYRSDVGFTNFFRMTSSDFEDLLNMIGPKITKNDTKFRQAIPASERQAVTLRFLATGDSYHSLMYTFKISKQVISRTVPDVCEALIHSLRDYVKMPQNERDWEIIAREFQDKWNFPHCVGAMDGKHITLQAPLNSGSDFF
ncbi:uncharacterized protein [Onthophagus taurus]|uniref:uncharacterized protein n=1 Tax=Onthophagus taurus TaxID=166361 RepID=UPI0039BDFDF0